MTTTQELHIALDILLQKSSSHWNKNFLPQEKDWFLNQEIKKFIKQRINPLSNIKGMSIFDIMKRVQDLDSLLVTTLIQGATTATDIGVPLPKDFLYYISSTAGVTCTPNTQSLTRRSFAFPRFTNISTINTLVITMTASDTGAVILFSMSDLPEDYLPQDNIPTYKKDFILNNAILNLIKRKLEAQDTSNSFVNNPYKTFTDIKEFTFNPILNKFELLGYNITDLTVTLNGVSQPVVNTNNIYNTTTYTIEDKNAEVRIIDEEFKQSIFNSYLAKPTEASICAYLREFDLRVPRLPSAIISGLKLTYLRQPRIIDVLLGIDSELPSIVLDEIVHNTAQTILGITSSDTYEKYTRENMLIE